MESILGKLKRKPFWNKIEDVNLIPDTRYWCYTVYNGVTPMYYDGEYFYFGADSYDKEIVTHIGEYKIPNPPKF